MVRGRDIERVCGLNDWIHRIESSTSDNKDIANSVVITLLWMVTQKD